MANEFDQVGQLRKLGIGLNVGGLGLGGLSVLLNALSAATALLLAGVLIWIYEYRTTQTVGVSVGVAVVGILVLIETAADTNLNLLELAVFAIIAGIADYVTAPFLGNLYDTGAETTGK